MSTWSPALAVPEAKATALTVEQWCTLPEEVGGECINGYLTEEEAPDPIHGLAVSWFIAYWILDPALGSLEIFELESGRFVRAAAITEGVLEPVPGCPGLRVDLDELWGELGRLNASEHA